MRETGIARTRPASPFFVAPSDFNHLDGKSSRPAAKQGTDNRHERIPQSDGPLPAIGRMACAMRGPRSRAGLMAYPVGATQRESDPPDQASHQIRSETRGRNRCAATAFEKIAPTTKTKTKVPMISLMCSLAEIANRRPGGITRKLQRRVGSFFPMRQVVQPDERGSGDRTQQLRQM